MLIMPKKRIIDLSALKEDDLDYVLDAFKCAEEAAAEMNLKEKGFSLVINNEKDGLKQLNFNLLPGDYKL